MKSNFVYLMGIFIFVYFLFFSEKKIPFTEIRTHASTCQKVSRLLLSYRGDRLYREHVVRFFLPFFFSRICLVGEKPDKELPGIGARGDTV